MKNLKKLKRLIGTKRGIYLSMLFIILSFIILIGSLGIIDDVGGGCGEGNMGSDNVADDISNEGLTEGVELGDDIKSFEPSTFESIANLPIPEQKKCEKLGPRGAVGANVPFGVDDGCLFNQSGFNRSGAKPCERVDVRGFTANATQLAINNAITAGIKYVFFPSGEYYFDTPVEVPADLTLYGDGLSTKIKTNNNNGVLFSVSQDNVRITRMLLEGPTMNFSSTNVGSFGIFAVNAQNVRFDHLELRGFGWAATRFSDNSSGQFDHNYSHHNLGAGLGYGVAILDGSYVLVSDNKFSQCRHMLASNGRLDWVLDENGHYNHLPGRTPHWTARNNLFSDDSLMESNLYPKNTIRPYRLWAIDAHPGMDGTCVIECNIIEKVRFGAGLNDGVCRISNNIFRDPAGFEPKAIMIGHALLSQFQLLVENAMPHDFNVYKNTYQGNWNKLVYVANETLNETEVYHGENISNNDIIIPETLVSGTPPPPAIPILTEMGSDGILGCTSSPGCP